MARSRLALLGVLVAAALGAFLLSRDTRPPGVRDADPLRLAYVATAHQLGVVGYRDPLGVIAFDGTRVALAEGRSLYETLIGGGARLLVVQAESQIRHVAAAAGAGGWIIEDTGTSERWWLVSSSAAKRPLFGAREDIVTPSGSAPAGVRVNALRQVVASADGRWLAATAAGSSGTDLWKIALDGSSGERVHGNAPIASPGWTPAGEIGCVLRVDGRPRLSLPCGNSPLVLRPDVDVIGPLAFAPTAPLVFFASPNDAGFVDLWRADLETRTAERVSAFARDTYAPSVSADGRLLFKTQSYRTSVVELDLDSGRMQQLSTLQAETPSYHPDGRRIAVTYGTWRRVIDDAKYPDIAQQIGIIPSMPIDAPVAEPVEIIADSDSEDQAMDWSPNAKWIVLHSHREQSDDIWLRPADRSVPDRRVSFLGRGAEVGWPRWSRDGRWVLYDGASPSSGNSVLFVIGIDQESGAITAEPREVAVTGFDGEITHGEWLPDSQTIVAIAKERPGQHAIVLVSAAGGAARVIHRFAIEHDFSGLGVAPDGTRVAFVAPASDGRYQIFSMPVAGGPSQQLTFDPTHKTQPAWSPDGRRLAYTVWSYEAMLWTGENEERNTGRHVR